MDVAACIRKAFELHHSEQFDDAERLYRDALRADPLCIDGWQLLGALLVQEKRYADAIPLLLNAIRLKPDVAAYHCNLAIAFSHTSDLVKAVACYEEALRLQPNNVEAMCRLAALNLKLKRDEVAADWLTRALKLQPTNIPARVNAGSALYRLLRFDEARVHFEYVLQHSPDHRQALAGLGQILLKESKPTEKAVDCWQRLAKLEPENPAMHNNLATILKNLKRYEDAEAACHRALNIAPNYFPALCNLGLVLSATSRYNDARKVLTQAVELESLLDREATDDIGNELSEASRCAISRSTWKDFGPIAYCQLAALSNLELDFEEAQRASDKCLTIDPDHTDGRMMRSFLNLQAGRYEAAWSDYEYRKRGEHAPRTFPRPEWQAEIAEDKTVLIHAEQGLGDTIHFIRYAKLVKERVGRVLFLAQRPLSRLVRSCTDIDAVIADGDPLPHYDFHISLLSLPRIFNTSVETIPSHVPYLHAEPELVQHWKEKLEPFHGFRIGIAWQGNREFAFDHLRSLSLENFKVLSDLPNVQLISLQQGYGTEQLQKCTFKVHQFENVDTAHGGFVDTAAIMKNINLVISSDTVTPHLAGALNVPVWLAKPFAAEWRWFASDRHDNPWYPSMRMFRQPEVGDWSTVFRRMAETLRAEFLSKD